ncbi:MAG: RNA polymerase sigma factor [Puniceicoccaceae bacterium]|nr:MAG: RNA polymerase sigma factor [Puniceicoccaceae bacterium]
MNPESFRAIVHDWYDPLYRFALSLCRNPDDALDLTQSAFHKLAANAGRLREDNKAKSWLFSTLHREFIDHYRRSRRFPSTSLDLVAEPSHESPRPPGSSLDAADALELLDALDERYRAPLSLFYLESFSYKEIAAVLDIPIGTVMSRLRRAKDQLRARLENGAANPGESLPFPGKVDHG